MKYISGNESSIQCRGFIINVHFKLKLYGDDLLLCKPIAVLVKGRAIHLSYVDQRTYVFCLVCK